MKRGIFSDLEPTGPEESRFTRSVSGVVFLLLAGACEDPLKDAQRLEEPRVIGVRVSTESGYASLEAGTPAAVEVLLAGPEGPLDARLAFELCEAADSDRGVPYCARTAFVTRTVETLREPIVVDVPAEVPFGARLALLGVACPSGEPALAGTPLEWHCGGDGTPLRLSFDASVRTQRFTHRNPDLSELLLGIGGVPVPLDDPHAAPACDGRTPEVPAATRHHVVWHVGAAAREPGDGSETFRDESLQLSHFSSAGRFERSLSFIDEVEEPVVSLDWDAPEAGVPVKLYLVVRDGRGGVSWVSASVCSR
jgi:hypothetical protein